MNHVFPPFDVGNEVSASLEIIKNNFLLVLKRNDVIFGLQTVLSDLESFLDLKYTMKPDDVRFFLIQLYNLALAHEKVPNSLRVIIATLFSRLSKRGKLLIAAADLDLELDWTQLLVFIGQHFKKSKRSPVVSSVLQTNQSVLVFLQTASRFFNQEATIFTFRLCDSTLFRPEFPNLMSKGLLLVNYMVSFKNPIVLSYLEKMFGWISLYNCSKWYGCWFYVLKKIATYHASSKANFAPFIANILGMLQCMLFEASSSASIETDFVEFLPMHSFQYAAKLLICIMDSELMSNLKVLFSVNQTQFHPLESSSSSSLVRHFSLLAHYLSYYLYTVRNRNPFFSSKATADFAEFLGESVFLLVFSKDKQIADLGSYSMKFLTALRCTSLMNRLVVGAIEEINASPYCESRFFALVGALSTSIRSLLCFRAHPVEMQRFLCALPAIAAHITVDNAPKSILVFNLLLQVFQYFPLCNLGSLKTAAAKTNQNEFSNAIASADIDEISACLKEFVLIYIQKVIALFESMNEIKKENFSIEGLLCDTCLNTTKIIFHQMSPEYYEFALKAIQTSDFFSKWHHGSCVQLAKLLGVFKSPDDSSFLQTFLPPIVDFFEQKDCTKNASICVFISKCLISVIDGSSHSLFGYRDQLNQILRVLLNPSNDKKIVKIGWKLFKKLLLNFLFVYSTDFSSFGNISAETNESLEVFTVSVDALKSVNFDHKNLPKWHVPFEAGVNFALDLCKIHLIPLLSNAPGEEDSAFVYFAIKAFFKGIAFLNLFTPDCNPIAGYSRHSIIFSPDLPRDLLDEFVLIREKCIALLKSSLADDSLSSSKVIHNNHIQRIKCFRELFLSRSFFPDKLNNSIKAFKYFKQCFQMKKGKHDYSRALHIYRNDLLVMKRFQISLCNTRLCSGLDLEHFVSLVTYDPYENIRKIGLNVLVGCLSFYPEEQSKIVLSFVTCLKSQKGLSLYQLIGLFETILQQQVQFFLCSDFDVFDSFVRAVLEVELVEQSVDIFKYCIKSFIESLVFLAPDRNSEKLFDLLQYLLQFCLSSKRPVFIRMFAVKVFRFLFMKTPLDASMPVLKGIFISCFETDSGEIRDVLMRVFYGYFHKCLHSQDMCLPFDVLVGSLFCSASELSKKRLNQKQKDINQLSAGAFAEMVEKVFLEDFSFTSKQSLFKTLIDRIVEEEGHKRRRNIAFFKTIVQISPTPVVLKTFRAAFQSLSQTSVEQSADKKISIHFCTIKMRIRCAHDLLAAILLAFKRDFGCENEFFHDWMPIIGECWSRISLESVEDVVNSLKIIFKRKILSDLPMFFSQFFRFVLSWKHPSECTGSGLLAHKLVAFQTALYQSLSRQIADSFQKKLMENIAFFPSALLVDCLPRQIAMFCSSMHQSRCNEDYSKSLDLLLSQPSPQITVKKTICLFVSTHLLDFKVGTESLFKHSSFMQVIKNMLLFEDVSDDSYRLSIAEAKRALSSAELKPDLFLELLTFLLKSGINWADLKINLLSMLGIFHKSFHHFNEHDRVKILAIIEDFSLQTQSVDLKKQLAVFTRDVLKYSLCRKGAETHFQHSMAEYRVSSRPPSERHTLVLQMIAVLDISPYRIEPWMPSLLAALVQISFKEKGAILASIREFYLNFRKSHGDCWHEDVELFTAEQLDTISYLNLSPSYFI